MFHAVEQGTQIYYNPESNAIDLQCCTSLRQIHSHSISCPAKTYICFTHIYEVDNMIWGKLHLQSLVFLGLSAPKAYILIKDQHTKYLKPRYFEK